MNATATTTIKKVRVPRHVARGHYQLDVLTGGHHPGVLSGAELAGEARKWSSKYADSRAALAARLRDYGVYDGYAVFGVSGGPPRRCRVWVDAEGQRVRVIAE